MRLGGEVVPVTPTEFRLITVLAARAEEVISRDQLAHEVWGYADASNGRTIDVHVRRLRMKLAHGEVRGPAIVSVRGSGYKLTLSESATAVA